MNTLREELYEPLIQTDCFAYCAQTESCNACAELICEKKGKKCPFFRTKEKQRQKEQDNARILLEKIQNDFDLRLRLEKLGITQADLYEKAVTEATTEREILC